MADALIDNPILNGPYDPPTRHWRFDDTGITDEIVEGRRPSGYFVPVPQARQQSAQLALETEWTSGRSGGQRAGIRPRRQPCRADADLTTPVSPRH